MYAGALVAQDFQWALPINAISDDAYAYDEGSMLAVDANDNVFALLHFYGVMDLDSTATAENLVGVSGKNTTVLAKFSETAELIWVKDLYQTQGSYSISPKDMQIDGNGNVYITGYFEDEIDFDPSDAATLLNAVSGEEMFIQKMDNDGNLLWVKKYGDTGDEDAAYITPEAMEITDTHIYVAGGFSEKIQFVEDDNASHHESPNYKDNIFVLKLTIDGEYVWSYAAGEDGMDRATALDVAANGDVFVAGEFEDEVDFAPGSYVERLSGGSNFLLIIRNGLTSSGELWVDNVQRLTSLHISELAVGNDGGVVISGNFAHTMQFSPDNRNDKHIFNAADYGKVAYFYAGYNQYLAFAWGMIRDTNKEDDELTSQSMIYRNSKLYALERSNGVVRDSIGMFNNSNYDDSKLFATSANSFGSENSASGLDMVVDSKGAMVVLDLYTGNVEFQKHIEVEWGDSTAILGKVQSVGEDNFVLYKYGGSNNASPIEKTAITPSVKVYPNPCNDVVNVIAESGAKLDKVEIYNALGALVKVMKCSIEPQIQLNDLDRGMYFFNVRFSNKTQEVVRIIKL